jgi:hypothetical protein
VSDEKRDLGSELEEDWVDLRPDKLVRMTDEELASFVMDFCDGKLFTSHGLSESIFPMVFMPVALGCFSDWKEAHLKQIGLLWEPLDSKNILPRSINGYPMFTGFRVMRVEDWERASKAINRELGRRQEAKKSVLDGI